MEVTRQKKPGRRGLQAHRTRELIVRVARRLFAERGFSGTTIEEVLSGAAIARGALYHHFRDKEDLFRAVYQRSLEEVHAKVVAAASRGTDIWKRLQRGREAYLDLCADPAIYRILLIDGPGVLSSESRREIQNSMGSAFASGGLLRASLEALVESGEAKFKSFEPMVTILGGAFDAAALAVATAENPRTTRREVGDALNLLVDGLQALARQARGSRGGEASGEGGLDRAVAHRRKGADKGS
jgi:AcrR family transcriptional regulator